MIEISRRLTNIDQKIHHAMNAIDNDKNAQEPTKRAVHRFAEKSEMTMKELDSGKAKPETLIGDVMELEDLGDDAKDRVKEDLHRHHLSQDSFQAVVNAHNAISELKAEIKGTANP